MKLGRNLARTFLDYYKLQNIIVFNPSTGVIPKLSTNTTYLNLKSSQSSTSPVQGGIGSGNSKNLHANAFSSATGLNSPGSGGANKKKGASTSSSSQMLKQTSSPSNRVNSPNNNAETNAKAKFFIDTDLE